MSFESDEAVVAELVQFTVNEGGLYRQQVQPILLNLAKKIIKGTYDPEKALVLWGHLADNGAKKYAWEFGDRKRGTHSWHQQSVDGSGAFPKSIRRLAAADFANYYNEELTGVVDELAQRRRSNPADNMSMGAFVQAYSMVPTADRALALARLRSFGLTESIMAAKLLAATWGIASR